MIIESNKIEIIKIGVNKGRKDKRKKRGDKRLTWRIRMKETEWEYPEYNSHPIWSTTILNTPKQIRPTQKITKKINTDRAFIVKELNCSFMFDRMSDCVTARVVTR